MQFEKVDGDLLDQPVEVIVNEQEFGSVAFPVIGVGSGGWWGLGQKRALAVMEEAFASVSSDAKVLIVIYDASK